MSTEGKKHLQPVPHGIAMLLFRHIILLQHEELSNELVCVFNLYGEKRTFSTTWSLQFFSFSIATFPIPGTCVVTRMKYSNGEKILCNLGINEGNESLFSNLALSRVKSVRHDNITKQIMNSLKWIWHISGWKGRVRKRKWAALAQLEERGSHNPEVVSSILTSRILFFFFRLITTSFQEFIAQVALFWSELIWWLSNCISTESWELSTYPTVTTEKISRLLSRRMYIRFAFVWFISIRFPSQTRSCFSERKR